MQNRAAAFILSVGLFILPLSAQQTVPFRNGIPVAPAGVPVPPLPEKAVEYQTGEGQKIRVVVVARGLSHLAVHPGTGQVWEVEMGPNGGDELNLLRAGANYG